ncbi:radical SAM protein [uncultured Sphingomonas sp.]|uniref:radical SAM protein n=1 Tax=uncultured Sphingomonas sp. TaxID=158754 RepID=UPI0035CB2B07
MVDHPAAAASPFRRADRSPIDPAKFRDPLVTAKGERRAVAPMTGLTTLWFNTGTLCNLACATCYIESSPRNDALVYLTAAEVTAYLDEVAAERLPVCEIGFTGGEPFMNRDIVAMLDEVLERGFDALVLTNAMRPMRRFERELATLRARHGDRLTMRVSLDHHSRAVHEAERGADTWDKAVDGLRWLASEGFRLAVAGRALPGEAEVDARIAYARLFAGLGLPIDGADPSRLVLFPEMDVATDVPEISDGCWSILNLSPASVMCASSRMVVKRRGETRLSVAACTLLPYDPGFDMGSTLAGAMRPVALNHPHCARFCVLGGASCSG